MHARQACSPNVQSAIVLVTDTCATCGPTQLSLAAPVYYQHMSRSPAVAVHYRAVWCLRLGSHMDPSLRCLRRHKPVLQEHRSRALHGS